MSVSSVFRVRCRAALLVGLFSLAVAGCQSDRIVTGGIPHDYRDRHPIQIAEGEHAVQMFVGSGRAGLTPEQRALGGSLAAQWRRYGSGPLTIQIPQGVANEVSSSRTIKELRSLLSASGVPPRAIQVRSYQPQSAANVAPILLTFPTTRAQVANRCHAGVDDLGPTPTFRSMNNEPYSNFGCATQHNLAQSVANPEDLVQPRAENPAYAARRRTVVDKYRQGQDPSTTYQTNSNGRVSTVGQ
ncbi:MAG: CpaD family pilus assembly protein [Xanthobacteraceae bacterium]|nr:CpaD family pilus assembly protein [Xanthobacteraceae bacterium]QYK45276.1 MAG: CpaD family pilus assembly protein [Xanthobacteraceae bacterium]